MNLGNGYTFAGNTASTALDPFGEAGHLTLAYYAVRIGIAVVGAAATWSWASEETSFDDIVGETDASIVSDFSFSAGPEVSRISRRPVPREVIGPGSTANDGVTSGVIAS